MPIDPVVPRDLDDLYGPGAEDAATMKKYTAYHFSRNNDRLGHRDGREIRLGETLSVDGQPKLCEHGLHGSIRLVDALGYASGSHLWLVEIWGSVKVGEDKICGKHRKAVIRYGDVLPLIVEFAYWCADRAAEAAGSAAKYAEVAKSAAGYAAKSDKYAAAYAEDAADFAESAAGYAAKSAKYAAEAADFAEYAELAELAEAAAKSAAKYAYSAAKYAEAAADFAADERRAQDDWWTHKLRQIQRTDNSLRLPQEAPPL